MHPDHARSFVLANSEGGRGGGLRCSHAKVHVSTCANAHRRVEGEGGDGGGESTPSWIRSGRVRTASSGVLNILRIPFARYLAGCFKTQPARYIRPPLPISPPLRSGCNILLQFAQSSLFKFGDQWTVTSRCLPAFACRGQSLVVGTKFKGIRVVTSKTCLGSCYFFLRKKCVSRYKFPDLIYRQIRAVFVRVYKQFHLVIFVFLYFIFETKRKNVRKYSTKNIRNLRRKM